MRTLAFEDPLARAKLEAILHPAIRAGADRALAAARGPYAVLVVPLLFETERPCRAGRPSQPRGPHAGGRLPGGDAGRAHRARVPASPSADVRAIMDAQWPRWRRLQSADDVVWNGGEAAALDAQCSALDARYRALARAAR